MLYRVLVAVMLIGAFLSVSLFAAHAMDVWVAHWSSENIDVYVMDDTLSYGTSNNGKFFSISTKMIKNGKVKEVMTWHFSKFGNDMWRYYTNTMQRGHDTVAIAPNGIFEYGMQQINWSYERRKGYYYY